MTTLFGAFQTSNFRLQSFFIMVPRAIICAKKSANMELKVKSYAQAMGAGFVILILEQFSQQRHNYPKTRSIYTSLRGSL